MQDTWVVNVKSRNAYLTCVRVFCEIWCQRADTHSAPQSGMAGRRRAQPVSGWVSGRIRICPRRPPLTVQRPDAAAPSSSSRGRRSAMCDRRAPLATSTTEVRSRFVRSSCTVCSRTSIGMPDRQACSCPGVVVSPPVRRTWRCIRKFRGTDALSISAMPAPRGAKPLVPLHLWGSAGRTFLGRFHAGMAPARPPKPRSNYEPVEIPSHHAVLLRPPARPRRTLGAGCGARGRRVPGWLGAAGVRAGQRRRPDTPDGLEQLEHVRLQHQRDADPADGRRDRQQRHARRWATSTSSSTTAGSTRTATPAGNLQGDPTRFPSGMKALGDYLHGKGLKFGIYEVPVDQTCAQYFGSYPGRPAARATRRRTPGSSPPGAWTTSSTTGARPTARSTTRSPRSPRCATRSRPPAGRSCYSINPNSIHAKTGPQRNWGDVANLWRTTEDITNAWDTGQTNGYPMGIQNIVNVNRSARCVRRARPLQRSGHARGRPRRHDRHRDAQPLRPVGDAWPRR